MKGREIEERLRGKIDPKVLAVLREMGEDFSVQQEQLNTLAQLIDKVTDLIMQLGVTIEHTQGAVSQMDRIKDG